MKILKVYTTLPFVPMAQTTQEGPPPPLPLVPIVGAALPQWGESLLYKAYRQWRDTMLYGAPDQLDPYGTTDGLELTDGDRYLGRKDKQYLPVTPGNGPTYTPPSDGACGRGPDSEHTTRGEHDMTDTNPIATPLITITDGATGTMKAPPPPPGAVNAPYVVNPNVTYTPVSIEQLEGSAPLTTYLEYLSTIKAVYVALKKNGTHKQVGIALGVLSANWLGDMLYHMVPLSGVPMTVGVLCLSSLLLRSNREKLVRVLKEYVE